MKKLLVMISAIVSILIIATSSYAQLSYTRYYSLCEVLEHLKFTSNKEQLVIDNSFVNVYLPSKFGGFEVALNNIYKNSLDNEKDFNINSSYVDLYTKIWNFLHENRNSPSAIKDLWISIFYWQDQRSSDLFVPYWIPSHKTDLKEISSVAEFFLLNIFNGGKLEKIYISGEMSGTEHTNNNTCISKIESMKKEPLFYTRDKLQFISTIISGSDNKVSRAISFLKNRNSELYKYPEDNYCILNCDTGEKCFLLAETMKKQGYKSFAKALYYRSFDPYGYDEVAFVWGNIIEYEERCEQELEGLILNAGKYCHELGMAYLTGLKNAGSESDFFQARIAFSKACSLGHKYSCELLEYYKDSK